MRRLGTLIRISEVEAGWLKNEVKWLMSRVLKEAMALQEKPRRKLETLNLRLPMTPLRPTLEELVVAPSGDPLELDICRLKSSPLAYAPTQHVGIAKTHVL